MDTLLLGGGRFKPAVTVRNMTFRDREACTSAHQRGAPAVPPRRIPRGFRRMRRLNLCRDRNLGGYLEWAKRKAPRLTFVLKAFPHGECAVLS